MSLSSVDRAADHPRVDEQLGASWNERGGSGADGRATLASIVIPAHNEEAAVRRCLDGLVADPVAHACEIVVVANGCTDRTAAVARTFVPLLAQLSVVELAEPGKIGALNAGDNAVSTFPRVYLDADVLVEPGALGALVSALRVDVPAVATPRVSFDVTGASAPVRAFYRAYAQLPYVTDGLIGLGVYGVSEAGRSRFGEFPPVVADDLFVQRCFARHERLTTAGQFKVFVPRRARDLVRVRRRTVGGARQLAALDAVAEVVDTDPTSGGTLRALAHVGASSPVMAWSALVYAVVNVLGRWKPVDDAANWTRDESSRAPTSREPSASTVSIDGLPVWSATADEVVGHVIEKLGDGRGGVIATPNVDIMRQSWSVDNEVLAKVDVLVPDGMPLLWAGRVQGQPLRERIAGSDLVWSLSLAAEEAGRSVFLLGGAPGVADRAAAAFQRLCPGLRVAGTACPPLGFDQDADEMAALEGVLRRARPDIVFIALGAPRQEQLALRMKSVLPAAWFLGCGGALDMAVGDVDRAPGWLQATGFEWLHRLRREPGRLWKRYLRDDIPHLLGMLYRAARSRRNPPPRGPAR